MPRTFQIKSNLLKLRKSRALALFWHWQLCSAILTMRKREYMQWKQVKWDNGNEKVFSGFSSVPVSQFTRFNYLKLREEFWQTLWKILCWLPIFSKPLRSLIEFPLSYIPSGISSDKLEVISSESIEMNEDYVGHWKIDWKFRHVLIEKKISLLNHYFYKATGWPSRISISYRVEFSSRARTSLKI